MEVKPGQYVALVGASGCGKSTCISLLERFYDPRAGQILVDGSSVSDYHLADYRKCISLVSQEPAYFLL
jgi:ATP-binding cassette, subfamily B (MDR/TAP), member 1